MGKKFKLRCKEDVGGCSDLSKTKISVIPSMKKQHKTEQPKPVIPSGALNSNVRELGNAPGQVQPSIIRNSGSYTTAQKAQSIESEKVASKARAALDKKNKMDTPQEISKKKKNIFKKNG